jgi:hypothetical protein
VSEYTHSICARCWNGYYPERVFEPERDGQGALERCCFCGFFHKTGIYVKRAPESAELACRARLPGHSHELEDAT